MKYYTLKLSTVLAVILLLASSPSFAQTDLATSSAAFDSGLSDKDLALKNELLALDPTNTKHIAKGAIYFSQDLADEGPQPDADEGPQPDADEGPQPDADEGPQPDMHVVEGGSVIVLELVYGKLNTNVLFGTAEWDKVTIRGTRIVTNEQKIEVNRYFIRTFTVEEGAWKISSWVEMTLKSDDEE